VDASHAVGPPVEKAAPPPNLLKPDYKDATPGVRNPSARLDTTPAGHAPYRNNVDSFGFKITLWRREDIDCQKNFWFRHDGLLYEAIVGDKQGNEVVVDGLCYGPHGRHKTHVRLTGHARRILEAAGYRIR